MKKVLQILGYLVLVLVLLIGMGIAMLGNPRVQTHMVGKITDAVSKAIQTEMHISSVNYKIPNHALFNEIYIEDQQGDTLLYVEQLNLDFSLLSLLRGEVSFRGIELQNTKLYCSRSDEGKMNFDFLFSESENNKSELSSPLSIKNIWLNNLCLEYKDYSVLNSPKYQRPQAGHFNKADIRVDSLNALLSLNYFFKDSIDAEIVHFYAHEKSGLEIDNIEARLIAVPTDAYMQKFSVTLPHSEIATSKVHVSLPMFELEDGQRRLDSIGQMTTDLVIDHASLVFRDLEPIIPTLGRIDQEIALTATCSGRVDSLNLNNLSLRYGKMPIIQGDVWLRDLSNIDSLSFKAQLSRMYANSHVLQEFISDLKDRAFVSPAVVQRLEEVNYTGQLAGRLDSMDLIGAFKTGRGVVTTNGLLRSKAKEELRVVLNETEQDTAGTVADTIIVKELFADMAFRGKVATEDFELGTLLGIQDLGNISFHIDVDGHAAGAEHPLHGDVEAEIEQVTYRDYTYRNLRLDGEYSTSGFSGEMSIDDENLRFKFLGLMDFSEERHRHHFVLDMERLRFDRLNLTDKLQDSDLRFKTTIDLEGSSLDAIEGEALIDTLTFENDGETLDMKRLSLTAHAPKHKDDKRSLKVQSDFLNAGLQGQFDYSTLPLTMKKMIRRYIPKIWSDKVWKTMSAKETQNQLDFYLYLKDINKITNVLNIDLLVDNMPTIKGEIDEQKNHISLQAALPFIDYEETELKDITLNINNDNDHANLSLYMLKKSGETIGSQLLGDLHCNLYVSAANDTVDLSASWENKDNGHNKGSLLTTTHIGQKNEAPYITMSILPSEIVLSDSLWTMTPSTVTYQAADTTITVRDFDLHTAYQGIVADGIASRYATDSLYVFLKELDLNYLLQFTNIDGAITFGGLVDGWATIYSLLSSPMFEADVKMDNAKINNSVLGDAHAMARLDKQNKRVEILGAVAEKGDTVAKVVGEVIPADSYWGIDIDVDSANLAFLNYWTENFLDNIQGRGRGHIKVFGKKRDTWVVGKAWGVREAPIELGISYLGTRYSFTDTVVMDTAAIRFPNMTLHDMQGNPIRLDGVVNHTCFKDFSYDINIDVDKAQAMQLRQATDKMFYGTVYASGQVNIQGNEQYCNIGVNARTERNTDFDLAISSVSTAKDDSFVEFEDPDAVTVVVKTEDKKQKQRTHRRRRQEEQTTAFKMGLTLLVEVTPDANIALVVNSAGDELRARGAGNVRIDYDDSSSDMKMFGTVVLTSGTFDFTLENIVHRSFQIDQGSQIVWTGDAANPQINASARYSTTASLRDLFGSDYAEVATSRSSVPVNCILYLTGNLSNPTIAFGIDLPQSDESVASQVKSIINTDEMLMREIMYLLVFNRFYTPEYMNASTTTGLNETYSILTNTLTGQINNWLSKLTKYVTVGFNFRTDGEGADSSQEYETQFQIQATPRLLINGNVGYRYNDISNQPVFGNLDVEYMLTPSGQWRAKAYTHTVDKYSLRSATMVQGVGFRFQHDFNVGGKKAKKQKQTKQEKSKKSPKK